MKKVLSLVLVIAMILSSMSFAFAGTFEDIADSDYKKAIETLTALGIVTGYEDGTYRPEKVVTRAEMAKLMVEILGYGDLVSGSKSQFTDTQGHWADAWIALAAGKAIVLGDGNGKFRPDATVSYNEAITMVVRALGYTDASNELKIASWPTNFKIKAAELGLTDDVALNTTGADRGGVAQLLYNALTATLVTVNSDGDVVKSTTQTTDKDGKVVVTYTELLSRIATLDTNYDVDEDTLDPDSKYYGGDKVDLAPYMYQNLDVYLNADDEVVYVKGTNSVVVTGTITDILKVVTVDGVVTETSIVDSPADADVTVADGGKVLLVIEDANEKEYKVAVTNEIGVYYNGEEVKIAVENFENRLYDKAAATVTAIVDDLDTTGHTGNDNGRVDNGEVATALVAEKATEGILVSNDYVEGKSKISGEVGSIVLPENSDGDVDLDNITVTGAVESLDEIEEGDVVVAYESISTDTIKLVVVRDTVEGKVTKTNSTATTVYVDGTSYTVSKLENSVRYQTPKLAVGDEGTFYLDNSGKLFAADTEGAALTDYALVLDFEPGVFTSRMDGSITDYPQVKLLTEAGDKVVYDVLVSLEADGDDADSLLDIDDYAVYNVDGSTTDLNLLAVTSATEIDFVSAAKTKLNAAAPVVVKYSVDEDGFIDELEFITLETETIDTEDVDLITADDVVVFNYTAGEEDVVSINSLVDNTAHKVVYENGEIAIIATTNIESANDGVFGTIKSVNYVLNSAGKKVVEFTAFVDGEQVTYLSEAGVTIGGLVARTTTAQAYKFDFNAKDEVESISVITDWTESADNDKTLTFEGVATEVTSTKIVLETTTTKYFATDCVVYIYDKSDDAITIGDVSDLEEGAATTAYVLDAEGTSRVGLVVQIQE